MRQEDTVVRFISQAEREYDRLCDLLDAMDKKAQEHGFYAVRSAIATQRELLRRKLGVPLGTVGSGQS